MEYNLTDAEVTHRVSPTPKKVPLTFVLPTWMVVMLASVAFFILAFILLNMSSTASQVQKRIHSLQMDLEQSQEIIQSLELQISRAEAPDNIQSIAVNRLGMYQPSESEIIVIPCVDFSEHLEEAAPPPREGGGIFRYLLDLFGL